MQGSQTQTSSAFAHYLEVKKAIDDRALNARVWQSFSELVEAFNRPRIFEAGCGIGTMLQRLIENRVTSDATYIGVDLDPDNIESAVARTLEWPASLGCSAATEDQALIIKGENLRVEVEFHQGDALDAWGPDRDLDILLAHAFLDLVDIPTALDRLLALIRPNGIFYFTLVFDGMTVFEPELDSELDARILRLYHQSMDDRVVGGRPSGDSRSGRHLFAYLHEAEAELLESGSSDWIVFPRSGTYPTEEHAFLKHILRMIETELTGSDELESQALTTWVSERNRQLQAGELTYIAHQIDFLGRARRSGTEQSE